MAVINDVISVVLESVMNCASCIPWDSLLTGIAFCVCLLCCLFVMCLIMMYPYLMLSQIPHCLEHLQNRAVRLLFHLHKFDHITEYYQFVKWLPFSIMFHQFYCYGKGIPLEPPIQFGWLTTIIPELRIFFIPCEVSFVLRPFFAIRLLIGGTCYHQTSRATCSLVILKMIWRLIFYPYYDCYDYLLGLCCVLCCVLYVVCS